MNGERFEVFHGTRIPISTILKEGLQYPTDEEILNWIKAGLESVGLVYATWKHYQEKATGRGKLTILWEMNQAYRKKIWVTDNLDNAWDYAEWSPEIVSQAIILEYIRVKPRRKNVIAEANTAARRAILLVGSPKVVVLDGKEVGADKHGINQPTQPNIDREAIQRVLEARGNT